jgi:hypothetical protein
LFSGVFIKFPKTTHKGSVSSPKKGNGTPFIAKEQGNASQDFFTKINQ